MIHIIFDWILKTSPKKTGILLHNVFTHWILQTFLEAAFFCSGSLKRHEKKSSQMDALVVWQSTFSMEAQVRWDPYGRWIWWCDGCLGGGNSKIFLCSPRKLGKMNPFWLIFFKGLEPPTIVEGCMWCFFLSIRPKCWVLMSFVDLTC